MSAKAGGSTPKKKQQERGGFVLGLIVGLLLGLGLALGVALYVTKVPIPFIDKVPQRSADQDAAEAERNKGWDPNAALSGRGNRAASGVVSGLPGNEPAASSPSLPAPASPKASEASAAKPTTAAQPPAASAAAAPGADPYVYYVQAGAYVRPEDAETQRAQLAMQGFSAKVYEREQSGRVVHRVRMGPLDKRDEAEALQAKLQAAGIEANLVRVQR